MALIDLSHTSHTTALTGIQRVCRSLHQALREEAPDSEAITFDPHEGGWRGLAPWETANLQATHAQGGRKATWPLSAKLHGNVRRLLGKPRGLPRSTGPLLFPEIFSPKVAAALPSLAAVSSGPKVAIFHDAIALKFPEFTPPGTVARFPAYLLELASFDGVAAVSEDSRTSLAEYWTWLGLGKTPPLVTVPLGVTRVVNSQLPRETGGDPVLLCVSTLEGRKNHLALLAACDQLWQRGVRFQLKLAGMLQRPTGMEAFAEINRLKARGRAIDYVGPLPDDLLFLEYRRARATVYPSWIEGFGLPVLESLQHGCPCVCANRGAVAEVAQGGGCLLTDVETPAALAESLHQVLTNETLSDTLRREASTRAFRTWNAMANDLLQFATSLARRSTR